MRRWPIVAQLYSVVVILSAGLILGLNLPALIHAPLRDIVFALVAALVMAVAEQYCIPVSHRLAVTVTVGISFATILLLGSGLAIWATAVGMALAAGYLSLYQKRWPWYTGAFNVGVYVLTTAGAAFVYATIERDNSDLLLLSAQNTMALISAGVTYYVANTGLVAVLTALRWDRKPWRTWASLAEQVAAEYFTLILLAILMAVAYEYRPWAIVLLVPPVLIVHHSLQTSQELRVQTIEAVQALADVIDSRDPYTYDHSRRVAQYAEGVARELGLSAEEIEIISLSARVHDLGKIGIRDDLLYKSTKLSTEEQLTFQEHVKIGADIIARFPRYKEGHDIIRYHHERYDGNGYLEGLRGDEIPIGARIIAVCDAYDAMTTNRPYRRALSQTEAIEELKRCSGTQFDPIVVGAFLKYLDGVKAQSEEPPARIGRQAPATSRG